MREKHKGNGRMNDNDTRAVDFNASNSAPKDRSGTNKNTFHGKNKMLKLVCGLLGVIIKGFNKDLLLCHMQLGLINAC